MDDRTLFISELIAELNSLMAQYGDLPVHIRSMDGELMNLTEPEYKKGDKHHNPTYAPLEDCFII
jgi:hypothetical protein